MLNLMKISGGNTNSDHPNLLRENVPDYTYVLPQERYSWTFIC